MRAYQPADDCAVIVPREEHVEKRQEEKKNACGARRESSVGETGKTSKRTGWPNRKTVRIGIRDRLSAVIPQQLVSLVARKAEGYSPNPGTPPFPPTSISQTYPLL